jgi:hypothetical protein
MSERGDDGNNSNVRSVSSGDRPAASAVSVVQPFRWRAVGSAIQTAPHAVTATGDEVRAVTLAAKHNEVVDALLQASPEPPRPQDPPAPLLALSSRWQELFWALPPGEMRHKLRSLEIDVGRLLRQRGEPGEQS